LVGLRAFVERLGCETLFGLRKGAGLSDDGEGELVVFLGDECYCVAVSGLELEPASGMCAAAACVVNWKKDSGPVDYACGRGGGHRPSGSRVLVAVLILYVVAGKGGWRGAGISQV